MNHVLLEIAMETMWRQINGLKLAKVKPRKVESFSSKLEKNIILAVESFPVACKSRNNNNTSRYIILELVDKY